MNENSEAHDKKKISMFVYRSVDVVTKNSAGHKHTHTKTNIIAKGKFCHIEVHD